MKKELLKMLICPACLPDEHELSCKIVQALNNDIIEGHLTCRRCRRTYPVQNGIAHLEPNAFHTGDNAVNKYETAPVLSSYLWSHYADMLNDENACDAYRQWAELMQPHSGVCIDAGCAVGRFAFEMSSKSDFAVGIDASHAFIQAARELMTRRQMTITLKQEGHLGRKTELFLPERWNSDKVEFIVADAQALPFRAESIASLASLNLIDKVPLPIRHLREMNRVTQNTNAQFLLSDPFSWSREAADEENWLGGKTAGPYAGAGLENIIALLNGAQGELLPHWKPEKQGHVWWKIRTHANHFELIRSCFVKARR